MRMFMKILYTMNTCNIQVTQNTFCAWKTGKPTIVFEEQGTTVSARA